MLWVFVGGVYIIFIRLGSVSLVFTMRTTSGMKTGKNGSILGPILHITFIYDFPLHITRHLRSMYMQMIWQRLPP